jgi:aromatic-L-amino-acid decarboxylase
VEELRRAPGPIDVSPAEFRRLGHELVDAIAEFLESLPQRKVTTGESPGEIRALLPDRPLPEQGEPADVLLREASALLFDHSLLTGHPRFWGYICGAPAPIGALADLLASAVNPNSGAFVLAPIATEIEAQTVRWIAELVGYPRDAGGLLVTGGNMANFVGFLAGIHDKRSRARLRAYASSETHTWINKAADLFGLGADAVRWIETDDRQRIRTDALREAIAADRDAGDTPAIVIGAGGTVSTGAVDPLDELAEICREEDVWFHVDGAYGAFAAALPDAPAELRALAAADSIALDPHKWLYIPVEAGCALVRDRERLLETFSHRPPYYHLPETDEEEPINYFELGPQNSRSFRALKVWLALRQVGRDGYVRMLEEDCALARELARVVEAEPELQFGTTNLGITTFRYVPDDLVGDDERLNEVNTELLTRLQADGEAFVSKAVINGRFFLRACFVNFRTTAEDVRALPPLVRRLGAETRAALVDG